MQAKAFECCSEVQSILSISQQASLGHDKKIIPSLSGAPVASRRAKELPAVGRSVRATAALELEEQAQQLNTHGSPHSALHRMVVPDLFGMTDNCHTSSLVSAHPNCAQ